MPGMWQSVTRSAARDPVKGCPNLCTNYPCAYSGRDCGNRGSTAFWAGNATNPFDVLYVAGAQDSSIRGWQMSLSAATGAFNVSSTGTLGMYGWRIVLNRVHRNHRNIICDFLAETVR